MNNLKILIISPAFPPISGVGVVRMSSLCTYLAKMNDDVTVICDEPNSENSNGNSIYVPNGIKIIRINCFQKSDRQKAALYYDTINSLLSQNKFDIALVTVGPYYTLRICYITTTWDFPERRRSIRKASSRSLGLPRISPSAITTVSAVINR